MRLHKDIWVLIGSTIAAIAAAPLLVHGDPAVANHLAEAAKKIEQMSPAERIRFDENARRFAAMPMEEQTKWRDMHASVAGNSSAQNALQVFGTWWPTVPARQRSEIVNASAVDQRIKLVNTAQDQMESWRSSRGFRIWGRESRELGLESGEFFRAMEVVEEAGQSFELSQEDLQLLEALPTHSLKRVLALLGILRAHKKDFLAVIDTPSEEQRLADAFSNPRIRESLDPQRSQYGPKLGLVRLALAISLVKEIDRENLKQPIGEAELLQELDKQPIDEKERLYALSADELRRELRQMILNERFGMRKLAEFFQRPEEKDPSGRGWFNMFDRGRGRDNGGNDRGGPDRGGPDRGGPDRGSRGPNDQGGGPRGEARPGGPKN